MKSVAVVVGDIGSAAELVPAVAELVRRGVAEVRWFADPTGKAGTNVLEKHGIPYESRLPNGDDVFSLVLVGASVTACRYQKEWIYWGRSHGARTMMYEDLHTTGARPHVLGIDPHVMLVIDEEASRITNRTRPARTLEHVYVVGKPTFEDLPDMIAQRDTIRFRIRAELEVSPYDFLVVYWSAGEAPEQPRVHLDALRDLGIIDGRRVVFAPRLHPKLPDFHELWAHATTGSCATVDARHINNPPEHLSIAADLVVAAWQGTGGLRAALLCQYVAIPLFPDDTEKRIAAGHEQGLTPLLRAKAALPIVSAEQLPSVISRVITEGDALRAELCQKAIASFTCLLQPGAVKRIADAVAR
ncbi:MAG: hypothetical protein Q8R07_02320, partial [Candidatus Uhrbacteria bacterium]|nr:hypothetical protein [Candidatus Uhrbacteria bacterium]